MVMFRLAGVVRYSQLGDTLHRYRTVPVAVFATARFGVRIQPGPDVLISTFDGPLENAYAPRTHFSCFIGICLHHFQLVAWLTTMVLT